MREDINRDGVPADLSPEYDVYVDDAIALAEGRLSDAESAAVRQRMATDPMYGKVVGDVLDALAAPPLPPEYVAKRWQEFQQLAGISAGQPVREDGDDLRDFVERTRVRERVWRRRLIKVGAVAATIVALIVGSRFYFDSFWTTHRTNAYATMTLALPDGSRVTLEPDSKLRHLDDMKSGRGTLRRDLYLTGSAEFAVGHIGDVRFSVQTHNALVVAIGTRFHVDGRNGHTVVRVDEGRVSVKPVDEMGDDQGQAVTVHAGRTARVVGRRVMIDSTTVEKRP